MYENSAGGASVKLAEHRKGRRTEDADCSNDGGQIGELGNSRTDDERECPVHDHACSEEVLSGPGRQRGRTEQFSQDVLIDDFDTNVAV